MQSNQPLLTRLTVYPVPRHEDQSSDAPREDLSRDK